MDAAVATWQFDEITDPNFNAHLQMFINWLETSKRYKKVGGQQQDSFKLYGTVLKPIFCIKTITSWATLA